MQKSDSDLQNKLKELTEQFIINNYDYVWLKSMIQTARTTTIPDSTLIFGSSHMLYGIDRTAWKHAINCAMSSQDLYYDFLCAKEALRNRPKGVIKKCFLETPYYAPFHDFSRSKNELERTNLISGVYMPIFHDPHNWTEANCVDLWQNIPAEEAWKSTIEQNALDAMQIVGSYFTLRNRVSLYGFGEFVWPTLTDAQRDEIDKKRATSHCQSYQYKDTTKPNQQILKDFIHLLYEQEIMPILVVTPYSEGYNRYIRSELKESLLQMIDDISEDVHFVDFNDAPELFRHEDFIDSDHLSTIGATKMSVILAEMFGT